MVEKVEMVQSLEVACVLVEERDVSAATGSTPGAGGLDEQVADHSRRAVIPRPTTSHPMPKIASWLFGRHVRTR